MLLLFVPIKALPPSIFSYCSDVFLLLADTQLINFYGGGMTSQELAD